MATKKTKYFYSKAGKRISKAEYQRREKISKSLKARNKKVKNEKLKKSNARVVRSTTRKSSKRKSPAPEISFSVKRRRAKVKTFPRKDDSKNFFYAEKRFYELDTPLIIESEKEAGEIVQYIGAVKEEMYNDLKKVKNVKNRLVNIGYDISLTFKSKDGKKSKNVDIDKICYTPSIVIQQKSDFDNAMTLLQSEIKERFIAYFSKTGFGGEIGIRGFETEISNNDIFKDIK